VSAGGGNGAPVGHRAVKGPASESVAPLPAQSVMSVPAAVPTEDDAHVAEVAVAVLVGRVAMLHRAGGGGLMECLAAVADSRDRRGVRHSLSTILGLCTAAVLSGCVSLVEITDWVTHGDQDLLGALVLTATLREKNRVSVR